MLADTRELPLNCPRVFSRFFVDCTGTEETSGSHSQRSLKKHTCFLRSSHELLFSVGLHLATPEVLLRGLFSDKRDCLLHSQRLGLEQPTIKGG